MKTALITGITGQDGSYLAEHLLKRDYRVFGIVRRVSSGTNLGNIQHIQDDLELVEGDITDQAGLTRLVQKAKPDEFYNLAAQSFVPMSWDMPAYTLEVNAKGFLNVLEVCRDVSHHTRIYQASTSEMFGDVRDDDIDLEGGQAIGVFLSEETCMHPRSPYGVAKLAAHRIAKVYRDSYNMYVASGILFNHESPRRHPMFVTRKITKSVAQIFKTGSGVIKLGALDSRRDWGYAGDYVHAMWLMLQKEEPDEFVIGTGVTNSVEDVVRVAFEAAAELIPDKVPWIKPYKDYIEIDPRYVRPAEVIYLCANTAKARRVLGWQPMISFEELIKMMVKSDMGL